jgi:hypothetical protein
MPLQRAVKYLIFGGLLLCPINGILEYSYTLGVNLYPLFGGKLFWIEKGMKDGLLLCVLALTAVGLAKKNRTTFDVLFLVLLLVMLLAFALTLARNPLFAMIGARSLLPVLMFLTGAVFLLEKDLDTIARILTVLAAVLVPLALVQFFFGATIYDIDGRAFGRFAARIFSTFCMPGSFGIFLVSFIMFSFLYRKMSSYVLIPAAAGMIVLTGSGMSLISLGLFGAIVAFRKITDRKIKMVLMAAAPAVLPFVALLAYYLVPVITGRANIWQSPLTRFEMMVSHFRDSGFLDLLTGQGLGYATNAAFNLLPQGSKLLKGAYIPESLYLSLFSQIGLVGGLLFIAMNVKIYRESSCKYKTMIPIFMFIGLTINLLELFPVNWLYMLLLGVCSKNITGIHPGPEFSKDRITRMG